MIPANFDLRNTADAYTESQLADNSSNVADIGSSIFNVTKYAPPAGLIIIPSEPINNRRTAKAERKSAAKLHE